MRRLQMMICLVFTVSFALFIGYQVKEKMMADDTPPVITCEEDTVSVSVKDGEAALLRGVIPARLYGHKKETGAVIEILLLKRRENDIWECLVKPGKKARPGAVIDFGEGLLTGEIIDVVDEGNRLIQFHYEGIFEEILDQLGEMPLPPYITHKLQDKNRYQTVYAKHEGSAAAPTAGLHFTPELLEQVKEMGVNIAHVTLHVGLGTFRPVKVDDVEKHHMHSEFYIVEEDQAKLINAKIGRAHV